MKRFPELTTADRADIVDRVFEQKVEDFLRIKKERKIFGKITGGTYTLFDLKYFYVALFYTIYLL